VVRVRSGSTGSPNRNATQKVTSVGIWLGFCVLGLWEEDVGISAAELCAYR
jgi:hypothetical protein